jgi:hypothetical protein
VAVLRLRCVCAQGKLHDTPDHALAAQTSSGTPSPLNAELGSSATPNMTGSSGPDTPSPTEALATPSVAARSSADAVNADALKEALRVLQDERAEDARAHAAEIKKEREYADVARASAAEARRALEAERERMKEERERADAEARRALEAKRERMKEEHEHADAEARRALEAERERMKEEHEHADAEARRALEAERERDELRRAAARRSCLQCYIS